MDRALGLIRALLPRGAVVLSVLMFAGYAMGLVRDVAFARTFGAGEDLDTYNAALALPEIALNILVAAGLGAAFVPVFARLRRDDAAAADRFSRTVLTASALVMAVAVAVLFVAAPLTVDLVLPEASAAQRDQYVELTRVMCVTSLLFAVSLALGEMLVARQRFLAYGIAPLLYNSGIVAGALLLGPRMGIMGVAVGTIVGALLHLGVRLLGVRRTDASLRPALDIRSGGFREYVRLSIPRMVAEPIEAITFTWFIRVASGIVVGGVTAVSFARNFQSVPVALVGIAFSVAAFPVLSAAAAAGDRPRFVRSVSLNAVTITLVTCVGAVLLWLLSTRVIELFLRGEAFDADDVALTASVLAAFSLSIPLEALSHLLTRAIFATRTTLLPVVASLVGLGVTLVAVELLKGSQGLVALPLAFAAGQAVKLVILAVVLVARIRAMPGDSPPPVGPIGMISPVGPPTGPSGD